MFERRSLEQILDQMISWSRGVSTKLTDFRIGSRARTIYEAVAVVIEEFEDRVYRTVRIIIPENVYSVFDFPKIPAVYASGEVTFKVVTAATQDLPIAAGTLVYTKATTTSPAIGYRTVSDAVLGAGTTSVAVNVVCLLPGIVGNVPSGSIVDMPTKPQGIASVTNESAFSTGAEVETAEAQKARFIKYINSQARGVLGSIEYGASTVMLKDTSGVVIERVIQALCLEYIPDRKGEVDVYLWNGVGEASEGLIAEVKKVLYGYYNSSGKPIYGFKPAGVIPYIYSAPEKDVKIKLVITPEDWTTIDALKPAVEAQIDVFFSTLAIGQALIQTAVESTVKGVDGVKDVKLLLSTDDGATWVDTNVTGEVYEIIRPVKPLVYA